jgi:hypothetical protein
MPPLRNPHSRYARARRRRPRPPPRLRDEEDTFKLNRGEIPNRSRERLEFMENQGENYSGFGKDKLKTVLKIINYLKTVH